MHAKRSLGQNFLSDTHVVERIVALAAVTSDERVLEIGPGRGALTKVLARRGARVVAVEKDERLAADLARAFALHADVTVITGDILKLNPAELTPPGSKIVANLPYNIATPILLALAEHAAHFSSIVVMVQKEVGERICAHPRERAYSGLSVILAGSFIARPGFVIGPEHFRPRPKVDSMIIHLMPHDHPVPPTERRLFISVIHHTFGQRRKMLRNTLGSLPGMDAEHLEELALRGGVDLRCRPQELDVAQFLALSRAYRELRG